MWRIGWTGRWLTGSQAYTSTHSKPSTLLTMHR
ncbi:hypothetical protein E2C01_096336 [Portunus trituberculatus]|uniref:Uncharacterized protein n=1 Tax=Portunus trituberculatus TaxID=210409 RepID=A0A5B7K7Z3_PORTR|nr:hypothetical protein [Portunus trituberculatus]